MGDVLVLNTDGQPLSVLPLSKIPWQQAMKLWWLDKIYVVEYYDDWEVRTSSTSFKVPSVVSVKTYVQRKIKINCTRQNVFVRDKYTCQYCAEVFLRKDLTIDHVIPSSLGGPFSWENLVAACYKCNNKKGAKIVKPISRPYIPNYYQMIKNME
jgi:5-methylcytosine-specific restriction endonuclease McrA